MKVHDVGVICWQCLFLPSMSIMVCSPSDRPALGMWHQAKDAKLEYAGPRAVSSVSRSSLSFHEKYLEPCFQGLWHCLSRWWPLVPLFSPWLFLLFVIGTQPARQVASVPPGLLPSHLIDQRLLQELLINAREKSCWNTIFAWYRKCRSPHWEAATEQLCRPMEACPGWCL